MATSTEIIVELQSVSKSYKKPEHQDLLVLSQVNLQLYQGQIVALLGKSGSGKSTLLRIISGLIPPTSGTTYYRGTPVTGPVQGMGMVFQNFALLPWLTVLENVELGLEALQVPRDERRARALKAIDIIGLDGFESAFPRELSGGMRQRVGFARAIVIDPDVLLMDEAFSALDVLTADNLKSDLLKLWKTQQIRTNSILLVTHNIEEAILFADRIIILGHDPGILQADLTVNLSRPRFEQDPAFRSLVDQVYTLMSGKSVDTTGHVIPVRITHLAYRLPDADISELSGLIETVENMPENPGQIGLHELADAWHLDVDELFPLTETLDILQFASVTAGTLILTEAGKAFARADILVRKNIFATHLLRYVPLAQHIRRILEERPGQFAHKARFLSELEDHLSEEEAERVLRIVIDWGRYAELFAYDHNEEILSLENPK
jgi:NitT/TauT family transport system ATP-binding protein